MKKSNMDLVVGGSILLALFILIGSVLWLKEADVTREMVEYTVLFPNIGTLQLGDPVMVNGVKRGIASRVRLRKARVAVTMKLDKHIRLTDSSTITVQNIGLLGERMIGIQLSEAGTPYPPSTRKDTTFIDGYFDSGIAEAMGMLGTVLSDVEALVANVEQIVNSTVGDSEFVRLFKRIALRLDTASSVAGSLVSENRHKIDRTLANIHELSEEIREVVEVNRPGVDAVVANGAELTERAVGIVEEIDSVTGSIKRIVGSIEEGEGSIGMLVEDEDFYRDLKQSVADLDTLVREVKDDGLKLRVKLGFKKSKKK